MVGGIDAAHAKLTPDLAYYVACIAGERGRKEEATGLIRQALADDFVLCQAQTERPGYMKDELVQMLAKLYPDSKQEKVKPGDTVIVVCIATTSPFPNHAVASQLTGGTRLKILEDLGPGEDGKCEALSAEDEKGRRGYICREDVSILSHAVAAPRKVEERKSVGH